MGSLVLEQSASLSRAGARQTLHRRAKHFQGGKKKQRQQRPGQGTTLQLQQQPDRHFPFPWQNIWFFSRTDYMMNIADQSHHESLVHVLVVALDSTSVAASDSRDLVYSTCWQSKICIAPAGPPGLAGASVRVYRCLRTYARQVCGRSRLIASDRLE